MRAVLLTLLLTIAGCVSAPEPAPVGSADPWQGARELVLLEEIVTVGAPFSAGADACVPRCGGSAITNGERLVPPGTTEIEVHAEWQGDAPQVRFVYDTGSSADALRDVLANGQPLSIAVTPEMTDAIGQRTSHWWWGFFAMAEPAGTVPEFDVSVRVTAKRGDSIATAPPGAPSGVLVPDGSRTNRGAFAPVGVGVCPGCQGTWWSSAPGGIVGPDATRVRAEVAWDWAGEERPLVGAWIAGLDEFVAFDLVEEGGRTRVFEANVDPAWRDAASQWKSLWWIFVDPEPGVVLDGTVTMRAEATAD